MKELCLTSLVRRAALALAFGICASPAFAAPEQLQWWAALYTKNPQYVLVYIDMRQMPRDSLARDVKVTVKFFGQGNQSLGVETFQITNDDVSELVPGKPPYYAYVKHSQQSATGAAGVDFLSSLDPKGRAYAKRYAMAPQEEEPISPNATLLGSEPPGTPMAHKKKSKKAKKPRCSEGTDCATEAR